MADIHRDPLLDQIKDEAVKERDLANQSHSATEAQMHREQAEKLAQHYQDILSRMAFASQYATTAPSPMGSGLASVSPYPPYPGPPNPSPRESEDTEVTPQSTLCWNINEVKDFLKDFLPASNIVPFLWGPPGLGKSESVAQVAKELGWKIIDLRLSQLNPVDLRGLPIVDRRKNVAKWLPPEFLPKQNKERGILFLDELNNAPLSVQAAAFQLILDKRLGDYEFPDNWRMVAAGNREGESTSVFRLPAPLANRFIHIEVAPDFSVWKKWAVANDIDKRIIDFLEARPKFLFRAPRGNQKTFPSPRAWVFASQLIKGRKDKVMAERLLSTAIGASVAHEFVVVTFQETGVNAIIEAIKKGNPFILPKKASERTAIIEWVESSRLPVASLERLVEQLNEEEKETLKARLFKTP